MRNWKSLKRFLQCPYCNRRHMIKCGFVKIGQGKIAQRYECAKCHHTTTSPVRVKHES
jgi:transcription elongation factor Elf1